MWQLKCIQRALTKCISFIFTLRAHNALREWIPACILPASWHWRRRQLQRFKSISAMHSVSQSDTKTSSVFMSIHKRQQLQSCSSNHRSKPVLAVLDAKQRCKNVWKITVRELPHIASSARCTGHLAVFVCSLRIEAKKKKANRYFVQTKRPCRSLFNFVPHYFQRLFIFSSIQAETTISVCIIAYLSTII